MTKINKEITLDNQVVLENINKYSLDEVMIGYWMGKPLYRKIYDFGALPNKDGKNYVTTVNASSINIVKLEGYARSSSAQGFVIPLPSYFPSSGQIVSLNTYNQSGKVAIAVVTVTDMSAYTECYITMLYTKTTDY